MDGTPPRTVGRTAQFVAITLVALIALAAAALMQDVYTRVVQANLCRAYAAENGISVDTFELVQVTLFSTRYSIQPHTCIFREPGSETPIMVEFSREETPYLADTMHVVSMVCAFLCVGLLGLIGLLLLMMRFGYAKPPLQKPNETTK